MDKSRLESRSGEEKLLERFMTEYHAQGPLTLARKIENVFSFLYATKPGDSCHFDRDLIDQIKAAALKGAAASENRTQESRWISTAERQPDKDGRLWAVLTESRRDGLVVGYIPMFEYYHFIDGWATDEPVRFWFEAELHPLPKVQK